ncbi:unnamed protein product [Ostreobium quekettii]|uniref:Gem-associated protein 2 n=1 Tax=Ostreobium quekettii TaxID=121088 RepID=A0A8S1J3F3_9CHLO|nr:unnamed protein product [Ostreobium quekettii]|eukprot:evm.model.scf_523.6 EVM.evm.TU.scf_523.6   scf_523:69607-72965(-)
MSDCFDSYDDERLIDDITPVPSTSNPIPGEKDPEAVGTASSRGGREIGSGIDDHGADLPAHLQLYGIRQALPVAEGEPDWDSGPPDSAEEYLRRVRWEALRCKQVVTADIDTSKFEDRRTGSIPLTPNIPSTPEHHQPTVRWLKRCLKDFHSLRATLHRMEEDEDGEIPYGVPIMVSSNSSSKDCRSNARDTVQDLKCLQEGTEPLLSNMSELDQVAVERILQTHIHDLVQAKGREVTELRALWLYALLAKIHTPLHPEVLAAVRALFRHCAERRVCVADGSQEERDMLPRLNLLIAVSGLYFGQDEEMAGVVDVENL